MKEIKGKYLRDEQDMFDEDLQELLGGRYQDVSQTKAVAHNEEAMEATEAEPVTAEKGPGFLHYMKRPALFGALVGFCGWAAAQGLMDPVIAVPAMCVCSACFGWNVRWRDA